MKRYFFIGLCAIFAFTTNAQSLKSRDVPQAVKSALKEMYPNVSKAEWEMEDGMYEVEFEDQEKEVSLFFTQDGKLSMTEMEIEPSALPENILNYIKQHHQDIQALEADKITNALQSVSYEVELDDISYLFNDRGDLLSKTIEAERKKNDR